MAIYIMKEIINIIGKRFGRLVAVDRITTSKHKLIYSCICDCGKNTNVLKASLMRGLTKSCGCLHKEVVRNLWKNDKFVKKIKLSSPWVVGGEKMESFRDMCRVRQTGKRIPKETRIRMSESKKGSKSYCWLGGKTKLNQIIRNSVQNKLWRESVFSRDDFTCICCKRRGIRLQAHHIKQFAFYPELRFDVNNGITLCKDCHNKDGVHSFKEDRHFIQNML
jgi:hypothetical protein